MSEAYERALACDPVSAFGGIIALNTTLDAATATKILDLLTEVVIAPDIAPDAAACSAKKKNVRLLVTGGLPQRCDALAGDLGRPGELFKQVAGGFLVQSRDSRA